MLRFYPQEVIMRGTIPRLFQIGLLMLCVALGQAKAQTPKSNFVEANGVKLHYLSAGKGDPVILMHGYTQSSHMWLPLMAQLAKDHLVIAPDLRGFGQSGLPAGPYTKSAMAQDVHALAASLGIKSAKIVGHDIGLMVA
jgi:pimeloyl-ACP methyl ester carboxylesterase